MESKSVGAKCKLKKSWVRSTDEAILFSNSCLEMSDTGNYIQP